MSPQPAPVDDAAPGSNTALEVRRLPAELTSPHGGQRIPAQWPVIDQRRGNARRGTLTAAILAPQAEIGAGIEARGETAIFVLSGSVHAVLNQPTGGIARASAHDVLFFPCDVPVRAESGPEGAAVIFLHAHPRTTSQWQTSPLDRAVLCPAAEVATERLGGLPPEYGLRDAGDHWYVTGNTGSRWLQVRLTRFLPGGGHFGLHRHTQAEEYFVLLRGGGRQLHRGPDGRPTATGVSPGAVVFTPTGQEHGWANGDADTFALAGWWGAHDPTSSGYEQTLAPADEDGTGDGGTGTPS